MEAAWFALIGSCSPSTQYSTGSISAPEFSISSSPKPMKNAAGAACVFLGSAAFIAGMLAITAAEMFPTILPSTVDPAYSLTVGNAANGRRGLWIGLAWWIPAILLAIAYFVYLFRSFRGRLTHRPEGGGY